MLGQWELEFSLLQRTAEASSDGKRRSCGCGYRGVSRPPWGEGPDGEGGPVGVVPRRDSSERIEAAEPAAVLGVEFLEVVLVPHAEDEAGAVELGVGVEVLDGPVVERLGIPGVEAGGVLEGVEGSGEEDDGDAAIAFAHLTAGTDRELAGSFDVDHGSSVRRERASFLLGTWSVLFTTPGI